MKDEMQVSWPVTVISIIGALAFIAAVMYAARMFPNATTPITLHTPKPGVTCAAMVTADGAAISCWKD